MIGDFVTFAPGVKCNGNIHIEDHVYIGAGAVIKQGTPAQPFGDWSWCCGGYGRCGDQKRACGRNSGGKSCPYTDRVNDKFRKTHVKHCI